LNALLRFRVEGAPLNMFWLRLLTMRPSVEARGARPAASIYRNI
jgi:hypothetical protein